MRAPALAILSLAILAGSILTLSAPPCDAQGLDLDRLDRAIERLAEKLAPSVVAVRLFERVPVERASRGTAPAYTRRAILGCSGLIRSRDGEVVTLIRGGKPALAPEGSLWIEITLHGGEVVAGEWKSSDPASGITILGMVRPPKKLRPVRMSSEETLKLGSTVIAVGSESFSLGQVTNPSRGVRGEDFRLHRGILTNLSANPGDIGGLLANVAGEMVGMLALSYSAEQGGRGGEGLPAGTKAGAHASRSAPEEEASSSPEESERGGGSGALGMVVAIPADLVERICAELKRKGEVRRGAIGADFLFLSPADPLHSRFGPALRVVRIDPHGTAAAAGLKKDDLLTRVDDRYLRSASDVLWFGERIEYGSAGSVLQFHLIRITEGFPISRTIKVPIGERSARKPIPSPSAE
ncbi:MAG: S1C family serine protease [Planctomycetota bacterium]